MNEFDLPHSHGEKTAEAFRKKLKKNEEFLAASEIMKQLSDPTRLKIFWLLCHMEECVINIAALLDMSSPAVSHHLRILHDFGLLSQRRDGKEVYYKACDNEECELLHKTAERIMEIACPAKDSPEISPRETIKAVHGYLVGHLSDRITIEDLSRQFLMNPTTLKREFKKVYSSSIAAHIREHRMEKAAELLKTTDMTVAQIASAVGYESQSRFTSAFKAFFNALPSEFRKQSKDRTG